MHHENADRHRHLPLRDQIIKDRRCIELNSILIHIKAGRLLRVVLPGYVNPVVANGAGENLALVESVLRHFALRRIIRTRDSDVEHHKEDA